MISYYGRFISNLSSILYLLNNLLHKNSSFHWSKDYETSFQATKQAFTSPRCLMHFDPTLPIILATDASAYGVSAVLSHICPDGIERIIQYASQTLSNTQKSYSQIDKKAYAIIFEVKKFYQYIHGGHFTLITDHRCYKFLLLIKVFLFFLLCECNIMHCFYYSIKYRKLELHASADCLSRLPVKCDDSTNYYVIDIF